MLLFLDVETTGLDPDADVVLEVGAVVVDDQLVKKAEYEAVIKSNVLEDIADGSRVVAPIVQSMHETSGLWRDLVGAVLHYEDVDLELKRFALTHCGQRPILANSSVHFDRRFCRRAFPQFEAKLHHRMVDVSTFMILGQRFSSAAAPEFPEVRKHRALGDIEMSLNFLRWYQHKLWTGPERVQELIGRIDTDALYRLATRLDAVTDNTGEEFEHDLRSWAQWLEEAKR